MTPYLWPLVGQFWVLGPVALYISPWDSHVLDRVPQREDAKVDEAPHDWG